MGGGRGQQFFRLAMGDDNLSADTLLYRDMYIATELLHCSHEEFLNLSRIEKTKLRIFLNVKFKKQRYEHELSKSKDKF